MKPITPSMHGYLDYLTVVVFLAAPELLGLGGLPALLSWTLAAVHLALTLITDFPLGWRGPALVLIAFLPNFSSSSLAFGSYLFMGLVIVAVGWLTDYSSRAKQAFGPIG